MKNALRYSYSLLLAVLREIFDENAYARFLTREQLSPSRVAYHCFLKECEAQRRHRPRCC